MEKLLDLFKKMLVSKWFLIFMELGFYINFFGKDIWGSLITIFTICIIIDLKLDNVRK